MRRRLMLTLAVAVVAAWPAAAVARQDPVPLAAPGTAAAADDPARAAVLAAARQLGAAENYTYGYIADLTARAETTVPAAEPPAAARKGAVPRDEWRIAFTKRDFQHFRKGKAEFWRFGRKTVALGRADEWILIESVARNADGSSDDSARGMARLVKEIDRIIPPHRFILDLVQGATAVTRVASPAGAPADAPVDHVVTLAPASVTRLLRGVAAAAGSGGANRTRAGTDRAEDGAADGEPPVEPTAPGARASDPAGGPAAATPRSEHGELRVTLGAAGISRIDIVLATTGGADARAITRRYDISAIGTTEPEPPDPAWDLLDPIEDEDPAKPPRRRGRGKGGKGKTSPDEGGDGAGG